MLTKAFLKTRYTMLPNRFVGTLGPRNPTASNVSVDGCVERPVKQQTLSMLGGIVGLERKFRAFLLPEESLNGTEPKNGDQFTDGDSGTWIIRLVDRELEGAIWRISCVETAG